ncbi:MAG TPA: hypothetical protein DEG96_02480 [Candidatus Atribacteria bacterium]|nr:hypothetical protein [Candidatus Atribacteria bacterium]
MANRQIGRSADWQIKIDWQIGRLADWQIGRLADRQIGRLADWPIGRLIDRPIGKPADWGIRSYYGDILGLFSVSYKMKLAFLH